MVSDNHGDRYILSELIDIYQDEMDELIHCGDSELSPSDSVWDALNTVKGNMDFTDGYPVTRVEEAAGETLFITHGHLHRVKSTFDQVVREAKEAGARFAFYGHTHEPAIDIQDGVCLINPGSISQPRGRNTHKTYALIDLTERQLSIRYFDENHNEVKTLGAAFEISAH